MKVGILFLVMLLPVAAYSQAPSSQAGCVGTRSKKAPSSKGCLSKSNSMPQRPVQAEIRDKGGQVFNVKAYGAKGNGTTDDTTAIQAAIDAAAKVAGIVYFPPTASKYLVATYLILPKGVTLKGNNSTIEFSGDGNGSCGTQRKPIQNAGFIRVTGGTWRITGLTFRASGKAHGTCILNVNNGATTTFFMIDHDAFYGSSTSGTDTGMFLSSVDAFQISNTVFKYLSQYIVGANHTVANGTFGPNNIFGYQNSTKLFGLQLPVGNYCYENSISHNVFEGYGGLNAVYALCANGITVNSNYFGDASSNSGTWLVTDGTVIGNYFGGNGTSNLKAWRGARTAINNTVYSQINGGSGTYEGNSFLDPVSSGCEITLSQNTNLVSRGNEFSGGKYSYCPANNISAHPTLVTYGDTDKTKSGINYRYAGNYDLFVKYTPMGSAAYANLPPCNPSTEGNLWAISDSTANTWGTTIAGGGRYHVLGYCDGENWTVMAR